jgi:hypothetical protein
MRDVSIPCSIGVPGDVGESDTVGSTRAIIKTAAGQVKEPGAVRANVRRRRRQ